MTDTTQQTPLPTLRPGDSHMESLIEAAIHGHASTREAMRWLVRQIVPQPAHATQADVTDDRLLEIGREWTKEVGWYEFEVNDFIGCARAILALHPAQVPMTDEQRQSAFLSAPTSSGGHRTAFMRGVWAAEAHHGIKPKEQA